MAKVITDINSSLNEVDNEIKNILFSLMNVIDVRTDLSGEPLWTEDRIVMTTSESFDEIKQVIQMRSDATNMSFPFVAYTPDKALSSVDHAMGNRVNQGGYVLKKEENLFDPSIEYSVVKSFQTKYGVSIWDDNFKAIRYYQDKISLRGIQNSFHHTWKSKLLNGFETHLTYLIGMPVINTIPTTSEKLRGSGFIYGLGFSIDVWGVLADNPRNDPLVLQLITDFHGVKNETLSETGEI